MKFGRYLEDSAQPEWRRAYIDYKGLKKLLKQVQTRRAARIAGQRRAVAQTHAALAPAPLRWSAIRRASMLFTSRAPASEHQPLLPSTPGSAGGTPSPGNSGYFSLGAPPPPPSLVSPTANVPPGLPAIDLAKTRMAIDESACAVPLYPPVPVQLPDSPLVSTWRSALSHVSQHPSIHPPPAASTRRGTQPPTMPSLTEIGSSSAPPSDGGAFTSPPSEMSPADPVQGAADHVLLGLVEANFDYPERIIFAALDSELAKITKFYQQREAEFEARFAMVARQLRELVDHRRVFKRHANEHTAMQHMRHFVEDLVPGLSHSAPQDSPRDVPRAKHPPSPSSRPKPGPRRRPVPRSQEAGGGLPPLRRATTIYDEEERRWVTALDNVPATVAQRIVAEDERIRSDNKAAMQSRDPEAYITAAKKLKKAMIELYRGFCILKNYAILNRTGFVKILKKASKVFGIRGLSDAYLNARVTHSPIHTSHRVDDLISSAEELFTAYFEQGDRKRALARLRSVTGGSDAVTRTHYGSVFRAGAATGLAATMSLDAIGNALEIAGSGRGPEWELLWRVYTAFYLPTTFALLFGVCRLAFQHYRINAPFIFEWDPRSTLDPHQSFELPAWLLLSLALAARLSFPDPDEPGPPPRVPPTAWPAIWLAGTLLVFAMPGRLFWPDTRRWLREAVLRVLSAGLIPTSKYAVQFADFVLGDIATSLTFSFSTLWLMQCEYRHGGWAWRRAADSGSDSVCDPNATRWTGALAMLPPLIRLTQCLRRWVDSGQTVHLVNGGKYTASILNAFAYARWRMLGSGPAGLAFWLCAAMLNSTYSGAWDVLLDWSLGKTRPGMGPDGHPYRLGRPFHFLLRAELMYTDHWPVYYWAMGSDLVLRCSWLIYVLPLPSPLSGGLARTLLVAWLEMLRRWQWMFIRVENEHLGNADRYRATVDMPLPYDMSTAQDDDKHTATAIAHSPTDPADTDAEAETEVDTDTGADSPGFGLDRAAPAPAPDSASAQHISNGLANTHLPQRSSDADETGSSDVEARPVARRGSSRSLPPRSHAP